MAEQSRAMTTTEATAASPPSRDEIDQIREGGALAVEKRKELGKIYRQLEGLQWGPVHGRDFSEGTRMALAEMVYITRANPQLHIDVLGGKPYLNAQYWTDLANSHDHYIGYQLLNLDLAHIEVLRQQAIEVEGQLRELQEEGAEGLAEEIGELRRESLRLKSEARRAERARLHYGVPDFALAAYEVVIRRYRPGAPVDRIVNGEIDGAPFVQEIREANWAPNHGSKDPIGKDHPHNTARTRTVRRGFVKAFSAWMEPLEKDIERLERAIEAEYTVIRSDQRSARAALPSGSEPQGMRSGGEATAARAEGAEPIPVRDVGAPAQPETELDDARARAQEKFELGCQAIGAQPELVIQEVLEGRQPENLEDWTRLNAHLNALADEAASEDGPELELGR